MRKKKYDQWYKVTGLKHVTGFLTAEEKAKMRRLAQAADKSLSRYVTRLMQQHIKDMEAAERRQVESRQMSEDMSQPGQKPRKQNPSQN